LGDLLKLTLFDIQWPSFSLFGFEISSMHLQMVQFGFAACCACAFPYVAKKYRGFFKAFADEQRTLQATMRKKKRAFDKLDKINEKIEQLNDDKQDTDRGKEVESSGQ
jgi:hypothetical protein